MTVLEAEEGRKRGKVGCIEKTRSSGKKKRKKKRKKRTKQYNNADLQRSTTSKEKKDKKSFCWRQTYFFLKEGRGGRSRLQCCRGPMGKKATFKRCFSFRQGRTATRGEIKREKKNPPEELVKRKEEEQNVSGSCFVFRWNQEKVKKAAVLLNIAETLRVVSQNRRKSEEKPQKGES